MTSLTAEGVPAGPALVDERGELAPTGGGGGGQGGRAPPAAYPATWC